MIEIIKNKELIYDVYNYDVILIGTSINNALGNGFQHQIKKSFPNVDIANKNTPYGDIRKLGTVHVVKETPTFCLLYINKGRYRPDINPEYIDYDALISCLKLINEHFKGRKIASTIIGNSIYEGDGNRDKIINILTEYSKDIDLYVYDYEQTDFHNERNYKWSLIKNSVGKVSEAEYREMKKKFLWEGTFGVLKPVPEGLSEKEIKQIIKEYKQKISR